MELRQVKKKVSTHCEISLSMEILMYKSNKNQWKNLIMLILFWSKYYVLSPRMGCPRTMHTQITATSIDEVFHNCPRLTRAHMMLSFIALHWKIARVVSMECEVNFYQASVPKDPSTVRCQYRNVYAILQSTVLTGVVKLSECLHFGDVAI